MSTETITLQVPLRLYADLTVLAAEADTDMVGMLARLVKRASRQESASSVLPRLAEPLAAPLTTLKTVEMMQRALGLSAEQWARLRQGLPSTVEIGAAVEQCLPPATRLSAEISALRDA